MNKIQNVFLLLGLSTSLHVSASAPCLDFNKSDFKTSAKKIKEFTNSLSLQDSSTVEFSIDENSYVKNSYVCSVDMPRNESEKTTVWEMALYYPKNPQTCDAIVDLAGSDLYHSTVDRTSSEGRLALNINADSFARLGYNTSLVNASDDLEFIANRNFSLNLSQGEFKYERLKKAPPRNLFEIQIFDREIIPTKVAVATNALEAGQSGKTPEMLVYYIDDNSVQHKGYFQIRTYKCELKK